MSAAADDFWAFSLRVYAAPGVERACLSLQERLGLDVNVLLFCCWSAARGYGDLRDEEWRELLARSRAWQDAVVGHLRSVRVLLRDASLLAPLPPDARARAGALRGQVKALELESEAIEQALLADVLRRPPGTPPEEARVAAAGANLGAYLARLGHDADAPPDADLAALMTAAFPAFSARRAAEPSRGAGR